MTREATDHLKNLLAARYSAPEWFVTFEVPYYDHVSAEASLGGKVRQIDALAVSRIRSRGNEVHAIEVKADRADWLMERSKPSKAEGWASRADRFYVCAGPAVVEPEELPAGWGLYVPKGSGLHEVKAASLSHWREDGAPDPVRRDLWVFLLRRALDDRDGVGPLLTVAYENGRKTAVAAATEEERRALRDAKAQAEELRGRVSNFEQASGLTLDRWDRGRIGAAVKAYLEHQDLLRTYGYSARNIRQALDALDAALKEAGLEADS